MGVVFAIYDVRVGQGVVRVDRGGVDHVLPQADLRHVLGAPDVGREVDFLAMEAVQIGGLVCGHGARDYAPVTTAAVAVRRRRPRPYRARVYHAGPAAGRGGTLEGKGGNHMTPRVPQG